jgi:hypothetical protein
MVWTSTAITTLVLNCKDLAIKLALVISQKTDLGQPIDGYLDQLYLICNVVFSLEEDPTIFTDNELDYFYSLYTKILVKHNRYKGI